jgi:aspartyl-tRNA(Asn)/glutamyl-tRNA(Gln) amidotransferase subunit A
MTDLGFMPALELTKRIAAKELSPVEVMADTLDRAETAQSSINPFITIDGEAAKKSARLAEQAVMSGTELGGLHGVPFSAKDLLNSAGMRTTFGSFAFEHNIPKNDCIAIARMKSAGAILFAKTTTPEFGHKPLTEAPIFGRTLNPWDLSRTSGGSSGGAAAAVAAGIGPIAIGTDGGGSTRIPAAACGVVGMKQTLGVVPHDQTQDVFGLLAYIGPIARTVDDAATMLEIMSGPDNCDPHSLNTPAFKARTNFTLKGRKIGWRCYLGNDMIDHQTSDIFDKSLAAFKDLGAELVELDDPFPDTLPIWGPLTFSIWASRFAAHAEKLGDRMSETLRIWMAEGASASAVDVQRAMEVRTTLYRQVQGWFDDVDLVLTPTLARAALMADHDPFGPVLIDNQDAGGLRDGWYPYTHPMNLTGHPAITVPNGWTSENLPVGLQIIGPWYGDDKVMAAAKAYEQACPWAERRPDII